VPFVFSEVATRGLSEADRCITDVRNAPIRNRDTKFRLAQQNMMAYTYAEFIPGFSTSHVHNTMSYLDLVDQSLKNADDEGRLFYDRDYSVKGNAKAKVAGDIFELVSASVMWNIAARWNRYMTGEAWLARSGYQRPPASTQSHNRQVAILNLPRNYDWVNLLTPEATETITTLRDDLKANGLSLPTSTPDLAVVVLPEACRSDDKWRTELPSISKPNQAVLQQAHRDLANQVEPGEILLAVALKRSLRSDRLYQPLYEANIMQLLLEGLLGAPKVDFEVHTLIIEGTAALSTYEAASLYSVLTTGHIKHKAVRELYIPPNAQELAKRLLAFLIERTALIS
jgi:hypothetical protein